MICCSALENNFHFNPNRQMQSGYCSIIVRRVEKEHLGMWTCAGRLIGRDEESGDDFTVMVLGINTFFLLPIRYIIII